MALTLSTFRTDSGFLLPSIHSFPPFFTLQKNVRTQDTCTKQWIRLIVTYARHRRLFFLRVEDVERGAGESEWADVFWNERIKRRMQPEYLQFLMAAMVAANFAIYEPIKQTRSVILYWQSPEDWGEIMHEWARNTGQLDTILTFYEITDPPVPSPLVSVPDVILRQAVAFLSRNGRAQLINVADGEGVRFFAGRLS